MRGLIVFVMLVAAAVAAANTFCVDTTAGAATKKDCQGPNLKCFRPKASATKAIADKVKYGCGTCEARKGTVTEATSDNCEECTGDMCNAARKCLKTQSDKSVKSEPCVTADATSKCFRPADAGWESFKGWNAKATAVEYGCGTCAARVEVASVKAAQAKAADCKECTTAGDNCNTKPEMSTNKCYAYSWSTTKKVYEKGAETDCKVLKAKETTDFKCSEPVHDKITETDKDMKFGCGGCKDAYGEKCKDCKTDKCNAPSGAAGPISSLAVLIAAFYMLY